MTPQRGRQSLGGLVVLTIIVGYLLEQFTSRVIDGTRVVASASGGFTYVSSSSYSRWVTLLTLAVVLALTGLALIRTRFRQDPRSLYAVLWMGFVAWWIAAVWVLQRSGTQNTMIVQVLVVAGTAAVLADPPNRLTIQRLDLVRDVMIVVSLLISLGLPEIGQQPCRADKCGIFGGMATGFFEHENLAAAATIGLFPALAAQTSALRRVVSTVLVVVMCLATASRASLLAMAVLIVFFLCTSRRAQRGVYFPAVWKMLPAAGLGVSLLVFLTASGSELTSRGVIYDAIRDEFHGVAVAIGSGADTMVRVYANSEINFFVSHEHGQAPHLLSHTGAIGLTIFFVMLLAALRLDLRDDGSVFALATLIAMAVIAPLEVSWNLGAAAMGVGLMVSAVGFAVDTSERARLSQPDPDEHDLEGAQTDRWVESPQPSGGA
ncbi:hypothetical protein JNO54_12795 [Janibacter sp. YIM B02568]|uniref:hypothetical protein n=1 Tax=Janibacter endophyticus TaxID=2806261 RepID=UPI00194FC750|nr:hypothetical protein [Janibacter endophyticus]MBM6547010.1 hypothetical protein [Janibacter endophyticus]